VSQSLNTCSTHNPMSTATSPGAAAIKALDADAVVPPVQNSVRLDVYYRTARGLAQQAQCYYTAAKRAEAYVFYRRLANLCLLRLPDHAAYGMKQYATDLSWSRRAADMALVRLAELKPQLIEAYARAPPMAPPTTLPPPPPSTLPRPPPPPSPVRKGGGAVDAAVAAAAAASGAGAGAAAAAAAGAGGGLGAATTTSGAGAAAAAAAAAVAADAEVAKRIAALGIGAAPAGAASAGVPAYAGRGSGGGGGGGGGAGREGGGVPPPPESMYGGIAPPEWAPAREHERAERTRRRISVPVAILERFMAIADSNTRRGEYGIETCGVLCGTVTPAGELFVSHLLVPKQTGTSDTCAMTNEEELFEYCMSRNLLTLGWIHTHPRQSCFMSSMDVHTHCGYQTMLPVRRERGGDDCARARGGGRGGWVRAWGACGCVGAPVRGWVGGGDGGRGMFYVPAFCVHRKRSRL
jgi:proteasome lid subunit RPN8/RPN11